MQHRLSIYTFVIGLLWCLSVNAQLDSPAQQLTARLSQLSSYQADFEQTIFGDEDIVLQQTKGIIQVKRPGKLFWQTTEPWAQSIVSDGETLWRYDADLEQVVIQPFNAQLSQTPTMLLSGEIDSLNEQYDVAMLGESYTLTPKATDNLFETLTLEFDSDQLTRMSFLDSLGQTTIIQFRNIRINEPVPDERFVFEPPAGVDILIDD